MEMPWVMDSPLQQESSVQSIVLFVKIPSPLLLAISRQMQQLIPEIAVALYYMEGKLVGINTAKISSTEVEGIGYAIPISQVLELVASLMEEN